MLGTKIWSLVIQCVSHTLSRDILWTWNKNITWFSWLMKGAGGGCCFQCFVAVDCFLFIGSYFFAVRLQVGLNFARVSNFYSCVMLQHSSYVLNLQWVFFFHLEGLMVVNNPERYPVILFTWNTTLFTPWLFIRNNKGNFSLVLSHPMFFKHDKLQRKRTRVAKSNNEALFISF